MEGSKFKVAGLHQQAQTDWLLAHVKQAVESNYWGEITISFRNGEMILLEKKETHKAPK